MMKWNKEKPLPTLAMCKLAMSCLASALLLPVALPAYAAEAPADNDWHFAGSIYLWGAAIGGETGNGGDIDVTFHDILENLDMTFMGTFEARKEKWLLAADVIYLDVSAGNHGDVKTPLGDIATSSSVDNTDWVITPIVGYNLVDDSQCSLDVVGGARYFYGDITLETKAAGSGPLGLSRKFKTSESDHVLDAIVGVKGRVNLAQKWFLPYYVDIGAGDSNRTWQAFGGVGYQFNELSVSAGYRYMEWSFKDSTLVDNLNLSGPILGAKYAF